MAECRTFGRICRACMCKEQNFHSILDIAEQPLRICEMFATTNPQIVIQPGMDRMPELICEVCLDKLKEAYHFQLMCITSDKHMQTMLSDSAAQPSKSKASAAKNDPLEENGSLQLQECFKMEILEGAIPFDLDNLMSEEVPLDKLATEQEGLSSDEPRNDDDSDSEWSQNEEVKKKHKTKKRRGRSKLKGIPRTPTIHNETDLDEKEKPLPRKFRRPYRLRRHKGKNSKERPFECDICQYRFETENHLSAHKTIHSEDAGAKNAEVLKPFICTYCDKAFQRSGTLQIHMRTHTGEKPFLCPQCGKSFHNASNMRQHLLRHSDEKRHQCQECPSKFACNSGLIKHMSIHRKTKPHVCDICGSSFTRSYTLVKHKYIHTGERPHKCEECNMTFVFIGHMRRHMRTHTGEKPYKCTYCDRSYGESGDLTKHLRTHVGENTYICDQCSAAFKYQAELREHKNEHYKEELVKSEPSAKKTDTSSKNKKRNIIIKNAMFQ